MESSSAPLQDIVIIYHKYCYDGITAAWAAYKKFGDTASYIPVKRGESVPEGLIDKQIYILDYSWSKDEMLHLLHTNISVIAIDHHISSENDVKALKEYVFDINYSGAYLSWQYFHPDEEVPLLVKYVSDSDINKRTLPHALVIDAYVHAQPFTFESVESLYQELEKGLDQAIEKGSLLMSYRDKVISVAKESGVFVFFEGTRMLAVNAALPMDERSHLAIELYTEHKCPVLFYRYDDGEWKCSLRSDGVTFDCTTLASKYGGGGHTGAAGFAIKATFPFPLANRIESE